MDVLGCSFVSLKFFVLLLVFVFFLCYYLVSYTMDAEEIVLKPPVQDSSPPNDDDSELISGHSSLISLNVELNEPEKMSQIVGVAENPEDASDVLLKSRSSSPLNSDSLNKLMKNTETKNANEVDRKNKGRFKILIEKKIFI